MKLFINLFSNGFHVRLFLPISVSFINPIDPCTSFGAVVSDSVHMTSPRYPLSIPLNGGLDCSCHLSPQTIHTSTYDVTMKLNWFSGTSRDCLDTFRVSHSAGSHQVDKRCGGRVSDITTHINMTHGEMPLVVNYRSNSTREATLWVTFTCKYTSTLYNLIIYTKNHMLTAILIWKFSFKLSEFLTF